MLPILSADDYLAHLQALLPPGPAWPRAADAALTRQLAGLALELARVDARAAAVVEEADPRTTAELLLDWERVAGLPDPCVVTAGDEQTTAQRRDALAARLTLLGAQTPAYYLALAGALGYAITITEFHAGSVEDDVDYALYGTDWNFAWQVDAALATVVELTVEDGVGDALATWGNAMLECVITRFKPAHTLPIFAYT